MKGTAAYILSKTEITMATLGVANITTSGNDIIIKYNAGNTATLTVNPPKGDQGVSIEDVKLKKVTVGSDEEIHLICTLDDGSEIDAGNIPGGGSGGTTDYADLTNKPSIGGVELSGDKSLSDLGITNYDDTAIKNSIKTVSDGLMASAGYSSDYKTIDINTVGGDKKSIDVAPIISHAKLTELSDIDSTDKANGKTLVYDESTGKHKYVDSTGTDELVKMDASSDAHYLADLIDKNTVVNENGILKVKMLDGQDVTIAEINHLKGLTMNVMDLVNMFSNGGVKIINTPISTYADLLAYDKSGLIDSISYLIYVLADETHDNAKTTYLIDKTSSTPTYFGFAGEHRDFTTNPIDLATEITGKLDNSHIDVDSLWSLLTINDTYKTLTTNNEVFGTHGAKALYDELVKDIGTKANTTDFDNHTNDTDIHITTAERTKWDKVTDKVNKTDITTTIDSTSTDTQVPSAKAVYNATVDKNIKTYTSIEQLGLTTPTTVGAIYNAIPTNSCLNIFASLSSVTDLPLQQGLLSITKTSTSGFDIIFKRSGSGSISNNAMYIGQLKGVDGTGLSWQRVCTTTVSDSSGIGTMSNGASGTVNYRVKNGICYVSIQGIASNLNGRGACNITGLPKPSIYICIPITLSGTVVGEVFSNGTTFTCNKSTIDVGYGSFSYPVAES